MPRLLHLVARTDPMRPDPCALPLLEAGSGTSRVVELFEPLPGVPVVDLSLAGRDVPEVVSVLRWADEVHVHGVTPRLALRALPRVGEAAITDTLLVLHGPWPPLTRELEAGVGVEWWPTPCRLEPSRPPIDPHDAELLPRACGPIPLELDDGRRLVIVALDADLPLRERRELARVLPTVSRPEVAVEVCDETEIPAHERAARRRVAQAVIVGAGSTSRALVEAMFQRLPIVVLGAPNTALPPGVVYTDKRDAVERCTTCVRAWTAPWARGEAAPVDADARAPWVAEFAAR